jgi:PPOX class probable F420-dependent enzyme
MHHRAMDDVLTLDGPTRAFLAAARRATLATVAPSGRPRLVPICYVVGADAPDGRPQVYSPLDDKPKRGDDPHELARVRDILVLPEATILIDQWSEDWTRLGWVRLDTNVALIEPEPHEVAEHVAAVAALRLKYRQYAGHRLEDRPILRFTILRAVSWGRLEVD